MGISQKCQYGLRAVFELAKRRGNHPTTIGEIASAQRIPPRFLELILGEIRRAGYVESRRGVAGGYMLAGEPSDLTVGDIIRLIEGPLAPVHCIVSEDSEYCPLKGQCAFMGMWVRASHAVEEVYDQTSFQDLIEEEAALRSQRAPMWCI